MTAVDLFREIDNIALVKYFSDNLKTLGFTEYQDGCFEKNGVKLVFCVDGWNNSTLPMQSIWEEKKIHMNICSIAQIFDIYMELTGEYL